MRAATRRMMMMMAVDRGIFPAPIFVFLIWLG
jgi:hypothetical protein